MFTVQFKNQFKTISILCAIFSLFEVLLLNDSNSTTSKVQQHHGCDHHVCQKPKMFINTSPLATYTQTSLDDETLIVPASFLCYAFVLKLNYCICVLKGIIYLQTLTLSTTGSSPPPSTVVVTNKMYYLWCLSRVTINVLLKLFRRCLISAKAGQTHTQKWPSPGLFIVIVIFKHFLRIKNGDPNSDRRI